MCLITTKIPILLLLLYYVNRGVDAFSIICCPFGLQEPCEREENYGTSTVVRFSAAAILAGRIDIKVE